MSLRKNGICLLLFLGVCLPLFAGLHSLRLGNTATGCERSVKELFMKGMPPFSFMLDSVSSDSFIKRWSRKIEKVPSKRTDESKYEVTFTNPAKTLAVRCDITTFTDFPAVEWTLHFRNLDDTNSPTISHVNAADIDFTQPAGDFTLYTAHGCEATNLDFHLQKYNLRPDSLYMFRPYGGRSSSITAFPFYNIAGTDGKKGAFVAIGWTGTWQAEFKERSASDLSFRSGMSNTNLYLLPGEEIRTPMISVLMWQGDDRIDGNNAFRRFALAHHSPLDSKGRMIQPPLCSGFDFGDPEPCQEYESLTELMVHAIVDRHQRFGIMPEVFWLDAGWYKGNNAPMSEEEGRGWYNTAGNWEADPSRFPNGLKAVADIVHDAGAKFMVWFEPERVFHGTDFHKNVPQYLLNLPGAGQSLFNLGDPEARDYLCRYMGDFFEKNGIDYYRQDFNIDPESYWAHNDPEGRHGITEIRYIEGLYAYWDCLRQRFPDMLIDNCASGGRRLDIETMSRSIPLWRTDCHYGEPNCQQDHEYGLSQFFPLHGTGIYFTDRFCARSGLSSAYTFSGEVMGRTNTVPNIRHSMKTYRELRNYFLKDFYPLSGDDDITGLDRWIAWQFHDPADDSGIVMAFRREECPDSTYTCRLRGLDADAAYTLFDEDTGTNETRTGRALMDGLTLTLASPRQSLLLRYRPQ